MQVELSLLCKREVDVADLSKAEGLFLHQIMTTNERIKNIDTLPSTILAENIFLVATNNYCALIVKTSEL